MFRDVSVSLFAALLFLNAGNAAAQSNYHVVSVDNAGTISGTVKWSGTPPRSLTFPITKDAAICDPDSHKRVDLERLVLGPEGGVANTIVFLKDVTSGKAMDIPQARRFLNQKQCRYEPHILLVPASTGLEIKSSDLVLHTVHMDGAASYNLPFPFANQIISRPMNTSGLVNLRCNAGHVWMNGEVMVVSHPYYVVTDESGTFKLTGVPPGQYQIVAWHEGWTMMRHEGSYDVLTEKKVERPIFSEPRTWEKNPEHPPMARKDPRGCAAPPRPCVHLSQCSHWSPAITPEPIACSRNNERLFTVIAPYLESVTDNQYLHPCTAAGEILAASCSNAESSVAAVERARQVGSQSALLCPCRAWPFQNRQHSSLLNYLLAEA